MLSGQAIDTNFEFTIPGTYELSLLAENDLPECNASVYKSTVEVLCQVESEFDYEIIGSQLFVIDQSVFSNSITWIIEDGAGEVLFTSNNILDTFNLIGLNYIRICQSAYNEYCNVTKCIYVSLIPAGIEICNNQIDDDGDNFVDLFDPDCPCTDSTFQAICEQSCQILPDNFPNLSMEIKWESEVYGLGTGILPNIVVGNVDSNAGVEIITRKSKGDWMMDNVENNVLVLDGSTGFTKSEFVANPDKSHYEYGFLAMGDIDRDGAPEFFFKDWDSLFCYNINGNLKWVSDKLNIGSGNIVGLADFNGDGIAEVYCGNNIVNAENGKLLMNSPLSAGCNISNGALFTTCSYYHSVAADLRPSPGLELAAGNVVYEVQINNLTGVPGNILTPHTADASVLDGITSVGDIDGDGELDVIVVRDISFPDGGGIWVWNPRTGEIIAEAPSGPSGGFPFIGDVDGDCLPEIGMTFESQLRMYKYDGTSTLQLLYNLTTTDESGKTGITMFDFNQDGKYELIYRDETDLRIINGEDGTTIESFPIKSGTGYESPVIADIDGDGEAEILVNGYLNDPAEQRVFCLEGAGSRWAPARSVWNQPGYNITNVNDDLTIPRYPQNPAKPLSGHENCLLDTCATPYNTFNVQATYRTQAGCVQFPAHDLSISLLSYSCQPDSVNICFAVENTASLAIRDELIPFSGWTRNPFLFGSSLVLSSESLLDLDAHEIDTFCYTFPMIEDLDSIFLVINDPGITPTPYPYPVSSLSECDYANNIDVLYLDLSQRFFDLGPDITKCESEVITLNAGSDFISYAWSDYSTDSIYSSGFPGLHFVETTDQCGRIYTDTVRFQIDALLNMNLGQDTVICTDQVISFSLTENFDRVNWLPAGAVDCDTCSIVTITSDTSFTLIAVAGIGNCLYQDTVEITILQPIVVDTLIHICLGDTLLFNNVVIPSAGQYSIKIEPCDTIYNITVENYDPFIIQKDSITLCQGDSALVNGNWVRATGYYVDTIAGAPCDIVQITEVFVRLTSFESENFSLCSGDSIWLANQWISSATTIEDTVQSVFGCDSINHISVDVIPDPDAPSITLDCNNGLISLSIAPSPQWRILWSNGDTTQQTTYMSSSNASLILLADPSCIKEFQFDLPIIPSPEDLPTLNDTFTNADHPLQIRLLLNADEWDVDWFPPDLFSCPTCLTTDLTANQNTEVIWTLKHEDGCVYIDSFYVYVEGKDPGIYSPNIFSPNGDGQNDLWQIFYDSSKGNVVSLEIFDRWGNMVHQVTRSDILDWNGTYDGQLLSQGVYTFKLLFQPKEGALLMIYGNVTLVR